MEKKSSFDLFKAEKFLIKYKKIHINYLLLSHPRTAVVRVPGYELASLGSNPGLFVLPFGMVSKWEPGEDKLCKPGFNTGPVSWGNGFSPIINSKGQCAGDQHYHNIQL